MFWVGEVSRPVGRVSLKEGRMQFSKYAKALVGALAAASAALVTALQDDAVTTGEWVTVGLAALGALGIVWATPNKPDQTGHSM